MTANDSYIKALDRRALVDLAAELVRTPSVNGRDSEAAIVKKVLAFAVTHGLHAEVIALEHDRPNLLVQLDPGSSHNGGLLMVSHLDTVSEGEPSEWAYPPFAGAIDGDRLIGRGSADNKAGIVASLAALLMLRDSSAPAPAAALCVPDEESGANGRLGVKHVFGTKAMAPAGAIYTYPGTRRVIVGHWGVMRFALEVRGRSVHSGSASWRQGLGGCNAVDVAMSMVDEIRARLVDPQPTARTVMVTTTQIRGGSDSSVVPGRCEVTVDIRFEDADFQEPIAQTVRDACAVVAARNPRSKHRVKQTVTVPPTAVPPDAAVIDALQTSASTVVGRAIPTAISGPANECYLLNGLGVPTCVYGPDGGNAHAANEWVSINSIFTAAIVYTMTAGALAA